MNIIKNENFENSRLISSQLGIDEKTFVSGNFMFMCMKLCGILRKLTKVNNVNLKSMKIITRLIKYMFQH